jgi:aspartyl protease family protein
VRLLWILLVGLALTAAVLVGRQDEGTIAGLTTPEFASLAYKTALLVFVAGAALAFFRNRLSQAVEALFAWIIIGVLLLAGYAYRFELRDVADRVLVELVPGRAAGHARLVELARARNGEFQITTHVNGARVSMVLDTGATSVVLSHEAAKAAGLPLEMIKYTVNIETANGRTQAAAVTLDRVAIGGIVEHAVPALIAQPGQLKTSLLGMSFLNRLQSWEVRGDRLVMRAYP